MSEAGGTVYANPRVLTEGDHVAVEAQPDTTIPGVRCAWVGYSTSNGGSATEWANGASGNFKPAPGDYFPMAAFSIDNGPEDKVYGDGFRVSPKPRETEDE